MAAVSLLSALTWAGDEVRLAAAGDKSGAQAVEPGLVSGTSGSTIQAAAELGVLDAQMRLARDYAGAGRDHARAFDLYRRIVDEHTGIRPRHSRAGSVASAVVALADYYRTGIPGKVKADKRRAANLYLYAASYFGDPRAQCSLAQMYLSGDGVPLNRRLAINWLTNASKKRYARAQAILGDLLWRGEEDVKRRPLKGLALLSLARQNAKDAEEARWIGDLYANAFGKARDDERESAANLASRWQPGMGRPQVAVRAAGQSRANPQPAQAGEAHSDAGTSGTPAFTNVGMDGAKLR